MPGRTIELGGWSMLGDPIVLEMLARSGVAFVGLDLQHGRFDVADACRGIQLLDALGVPSFVRLAVDQLHDVSRVLDAGARGIIVAMVASAEDARRAVSSARYQPHGSRSYAGQRFGLGSEPPDVTQVRPEVHVMVERPSVLRELATIADIDGVTGLCVGPVDLSLGLGCGARPKLEEPSYRTTLQSVVQVAAERSLVTTTFASSGRAVRDWASMGFTRVVVSSDVALLRRSLKAEIADARPGLAGDEHDRPPQR